MERSLSFMATVMLIAAGTVTGAGQIATFPTPSPPVSAEQTEWYLGGEAIAFGGIVHYPSGPIRHFNRDEMVQTGLFDGIPLYIRTTGEPRSVIYVPLSGGLVRPYEQRRAGDLAGTTGSMPPRFPVVLPAEDRERIAAGPLRAPAPPTGLPVSAVGTAAPPAADALGRADERPEPAGTRGAPDAPAATPRHVRIGPAPAGVNGVFIEYRDRRWFVAGAAVERTPALRQVGEYAGFPVLADPGRPDLIYLPVAADTPGLVTPYAQR